MDKNEYVLDNNAPNVLDNNAPSVPYNNQPYMNVPNQNNQYNQTPIMQQPGIYTNQQYINPNQMQLNPMQQQMQLNPMQVNQMQQQMIHNNNQPRVMVYGNQMNQMNNMMGVMPMSWDMMNNVLFTNNPLEALQYAKEAIIKQKLEIFEMLTGCETPNRYYVFLKDPQTGAKTFLFKCKEESDACMRFCCSGSMRSFKMKIKHHTNATEDPSDVFAWLERPFTCTCCCIARPQMSATINNQYVGKVYEPCTLMDPLFHVIDKNNNIKWKIHTNYCQCGICCRNSCGVCSEVIFPIYHGNATEFDQSQSDGYVKKSFKGRELISDANSFHIAFPSTATPEDKFLILATVLMIDYQYYEERPENRQYY